MGDGLSNDLLRIDVPLPPGAPLGELQIRANSIDATSWTLRAFVPVSDYVAAVAVEGPITRLQFYQGQV